MVPKSLESAKLLPESFSPEQTDLINGTLLGNGYLELSTKGDSWRYRAGQRTNENNLLLDKHLILSNICGGTGPFQISDKKTGLIALRKGFNTLTTKLLVPFGEAFYHLDSSTGRSCKKVPSDLATRLNPRSFAWFYADTGIMRWKNKSNATRLCVERYKPEEIIFIAETIEKNFNLPCTLPRKRNSYTIHFPEKSYPILRELIGPYLHPDIFYRFPDGNKGTFKGMC